MVGKSSLQEIATLEIIRARYQTLIWRPGDIRSKIWSLSDYPGELTALRFELKIRSRSLFLTPTTNFSSWQITMPLYNSTEVFVPAEQYGNTIHSPWILNRLKVTHYVPLFTSDHMCTNSFFSSNTFQCTIMTLTLSKPFGSYCFCSSHLLSSFVFKTPLGK